MRAILGRADEVEPYVLCRLRLPRDVVGLHLHRSWYVQLIVESGPHCIPWDQIEDVKSESMTFPGEKAGKPEREVAQSNR
jgi:hypothetical protein